ncbi:MAG TPA: LacI family transcriptional regulator, partial [Lachnospiraceae bacterium]|nr:LacI family transcriptional regulator [Lachnospiraceae bacterium]
MEQITIKEIAKICGVGVSTVSRAINNHPDINPETKKKILDTITEYQYIPNNSARNLKRSESNTIAVLAKGISNPLFGAMVQMLERDILGKQYLFVLQQVDEDENEIEVAIRLEKEKRLKGIIFLGGASHPREDLLHQLTVPYVICTVNAVLEESLDNFGVVSIDDEAESYRMVDYLCRMGHRRIAILTSLARDSSIGTLRLEGYKRALRDNGIEYDESLVVTMDPDEQTYTMQNGYQQTKQLLSRGVPFTAVYA